MIDNKRRIFLRNSSALAAASALTACGGGTPEEVQSALSSGAETKTAATVTTSPIPNWGTTARIPGARIFISSTTGETLVPFTLGFAFKRGDVIAGRTVTGDTASLQVNVKNRWPDGSVKFAILSGIALVPTAAGITVNLSTASEQAQGSPIDTTRLRSSGAVAEVGCGAFGTARWSATDWDSPFKTWVAGPSMSSWIYRQPVGADKHLVAWLEVRLYANGAVEILPWIENGYLLVTGPSNKAATYSFMLNRSQRMTAAIDLKHHSRTPLINGSALSYWAGQDPGVIARPDTAYLQATELVPSYTGQLSTSSVVLTGLVSSYVPLQAGNFKYDQDSMASSGYQDPIGLLPQHDVAYLVSNDVRAYAAVIRNGFSAGRWAIHYRDERTNRPPRFSAYPTLNISSSQGFKDVGGSTNGKRTPLATGGNPPGWDVAHSPSVGFLAYLLTGRWYFMEEVQFATTANYLGNGDNTVLRTGSKGLVQPCPGAWQTRSCAWDWRARVQALCVTPDDDVELRSEFVASVEANIEHFHSRYVAQKNNPFGWIKPGEAYNGSLRLGSPWQQDFATASFGYSVSLGLPISITASTKLSAFFAWKAKSAIMRLGTKEGFWYINAVPYNMAISPSATPDYNTGTGPWYATEAEVYAATYAVPPAWLGRTEGMLAGEIMPGERAMWGNLVPAIAYAVQHNVQGAQEAYNRMVSAANWKALADAFNARPVWGVKPARYIGAPIVVVPPPTTTQPETQPEPPKVGDPAWFAGSSLHQWIEIPSTAGAGGAALGAFSGIAYNEATNEVLVAGAGGHLDSSDNRVVALRLTDDAPRWRLLLGGSTTVKMDVSHYPDGRPTSRHTYNTTHYIPQLNRVIMFGVRGAYGNAHSFPNVDGFNLATNSWDPAGTFANAPVGHLGAVWIRATGEVWSNNLARWSPVTKTWTLPITKRSGDQSRWPLAHDSSRNQIFSLQWADGMGYSTQALFASRVPVNGSEQISVKFNPSPALTSFIADKPTYAGMDYDPHNDRFLFYCGQGVGAGRVYAVAPNAGNVWDMSILKLVPGATVPATPSSGVSNRFRYIPALRGFLMIPHGKSNLFFLRVAP